MQINMQHERCTDSVRILRARLEDALKERSIPIFAVIDHAHNATQAGLTMRPATVVVFGNPAAGTLLMQLAPVMALDLPLRMLLWEDDAGITWCSWHDIRQVAVCYGVPEEHEVVVRSASLLQALARHVSMFLPGVTLEDPWQGIP